MTSHFNPEHVGTKFMLLHTQLLDNPYLEDVEEFMHQYRHAKTQHLHHYLKHRSNPRLRIDFEHLRQCDENGLQRLELRV